MKTFNLIVLLSALVMTGCATADHKRTFGNPSTMSEEELRSENEYLRLRIENDRLRSTASNRGKQAVQRERGQLSYNGSVPRSWPNGAQRRVRHLNTYYDKKGKKCERYEVEHALNGYVQTSIGYRCHNPWTRSNDWQTW